MDPKAINLPENADELLQIQKELKEEGDILKKVVEQIDKQIHALQIEKMHLMDTYYKNTSKNDTLSTEFIEVKNIELQPQITEKSQNPDESNFNIDLNLDISSMFNYEEEEEDSEEEEDYDDHM